MSAVLCGDETIDTPYGEVELQHTVDISIGREAPDGMETNFMHTLGTDG